MDLRITILVSLQIINIASKRYVSSSDESIENLLYFKDCQHKSKEVTTTLAPVVRLIATPKPQAMDCPYPKMCCSLTCGGNECGNGGGPSPFAAAARQGPPRPPMSPPDTFSPIGPMGGPQQRPQMMQPPMPRGRKKRVKQPMRIQLQPPIGGRRSFGFTKEQIKNLINQDEDIRKILKDLVRVTMKKVDLVDIMNRKSADPQPVETPRHSSEGEDDDLE